MEKPEFPHGEFDNGAHWQSNQDEHLRYDKPDIPVEPPLEPHTPCEVCGLQLAVVEIDIVDENSTQRDIPMCFECYNKMEHDNSLEPADSHYYPRS